MIGHSFSSEELGFSTMEPWLVELRHASELSVRRLSRNLPVLEAKICQLLTPIPSSSDDTENDDAGPRNEVVTPKKKATSSMVPSSEVDWVLTEPGVSNFLIDFSYVTLTRWI